jgi:DNA invertase Pin-like site-specific DNA recombinase
MKVGYCRVSTEDQNPNLQTDALRKAGCIKLYSDRGVSGALSKRPALDKCLRALHEGDTLVVWKMDRLGRSLGHLIATLDDLRKRGIKFQSLTEHVDTATPTGRAMWQMLGVLAELERSMIAERTAAGRAAAKKRGVRFGRKPKLSSEQIRHASELVASGRPIPEIAALMKVHRITVYRALQAHQAG